MFPFTVYHVADPVQRRYTFYADSDPVRAEWISAIQEAKTIRDVYQNENKVFGYYTNCVVFLIFDFF